MPLYAVLRGGVAVGEILADDEDAARAELAHERIFGDLPVELVEMPS